MLSEAKINSNYVIFCKCLEKYNCYSKEMIDNMGEKIKNASYSMNEIYGAAYNGSMIDITLNVLCKLGIEINEKVLGSDEKKNKIQYNELYVNKNMLMRVLLLINISKADMYIETKDNWKKNKGILYEFSNKLRTKLKLGQRTLFICQKYGIKLAEEEFESISSIDSDDRNGDIFMSPLSNLVKSIYSLTEIKLRQEYLNKNKVEELEK